MPVSGAFINRMPNRTALYPETFWEFVRAHRFAIVHFWASWNAYDEIMRRMLEDQLSVELQERIALGSFETDPPTHHELCLHHNILNLPFIALYRDGELFRSITGSLEPSTLDRHLREMLSATTE